TASATRAAHGAPSRRGRGALSGAAPERNAMTCASMASDLIDLARGLAPGAERARSIERHVRECADCAARLDRERALSAEMRRLAEDTLAPPLDPAQESAVLTAFDAAHTRRS